MLFIYLYLDFIQTAGKFKPIYISPKEKKDYLIEVCSYFRPKHKLYLVVDVLKPIFNLFVFIK